MNYYPIKSYSSLGMMSMKYDMFNIESTPADEPCLQVGSDLYNKQQAVIEATAHIDQMIRCYGQPPKGVSFFIMSNEHDAGTYYDVAIKFLVDEDDENCPAADYAYECEQGAFTTDELGDKVCKWDAVALEFLKEQSYALFKEPIKVEFKPNKILKLKSA
jgi:hypothetical protein